jgi:hypothetical protein
MPLASTELPPLLLPQGLLLLLLLLVLLALLLRKSRWALASPGAFGKRRPSRESVNPRTSTTYQSPWSSGLAGMSTALPLVVGAHASSSIQ